MIPIAVPNIGDAEGANLAECVATAMVSSVGPFVTTFEELVGRVAGSSLPAVATSAGTTALHAAFTAVGVGPGDLVLAPSFTFIATANAISHAGAAPWLLEVTEESWTLDPDRLAEIVATECERDAQGALRRRSCGRRVAAVAPVYTLGHPPDMPRIAEIAAACGLPVVSDAAAGIGSEIRGARIAEHGAALSAFSFNGNKTFTSGGGGALVGDDQKLLAYVRHLTTTARCGPGYDYDAVGFNYRMTNLQAAVGCAQIARFDEFTKSKRRIAARYAEAFRDLDGAEPFPTAPWAKNAHWLSGLYAPGLSESEVESLRRGLQASGVDARPFWKPLHLQKPYADAPCAELCATDRIWRRVAPLPCSTALSEDDQAKVIEAVLKHWPRN